MAFINGKKISPNGQPWQIHEEGRITLPSN
jgi:hypothetical protein